MLLWMRANSTQSQVQDSTADQQNSTQKIRVKPSETAKLIGTAVKWRSNVDQAITESKATGRPVFWYVPTVPGSFMDRKPEIDRYMLAGPFSWPRIIDTLNDQFIPVRGQPDAKQQQKYGLVRYKFIEPGFVVLDGDANKIMAVDRMTTLHPDWIQALLARAQRQSDVTTAAQQGFKRGVDENTIGRLEIPTGTGRQ